VTGTPAQGSLCVLVGPSGSGKSSLLAAILGEMALTGGAYEVSGACALAPQQPWLIADTIQANIIMDRPLHERRYQAVRCGLLPAPRAAALQRARDQGSLR
jgi:ABC-type transport system involved in cytochrome bd biosynthesis fused ATPase/permease subunit